MPKKIKSESISQEGFCDKLFLLLWKKDPIFDSSTYYLVITFLKHSFRANYQHPSYDYDQIPTGLYMVLHQQRRQDQTEVKRKVGEGLHQGGVLKQKSKGKGHSGHIYTETTFEK